MRIRLIGVCLSDTGSVQSLVISITCNIPETCLSVLYGPRFKYEPHIKMLKRMAYFFPVNSPLSGRQMLIFCTMVIMQVHMYNLVKTFIKEFIHPCIGIGMPHIKGQPQVFKALALCLKVYIRNIFKISQIKQQKPLLLCKLLCPARKTSFRYHCKIFFSFPGIPVNESGFLLQIL